ncbi:TPA: hypothetical protein PWK61_001399 [Escherichia coli]|nr:hypothetical protein [Escherichia coli]
MNTIFSTYKCSNRVWRLLIATSDIIDGNKPVKDLRRKLKRMVRSIKDVEKQLKYFESIYEPPRIIVIKPHDGVSSWFFIIPCWGDNYEIITPDTYEEFIVNDKKCFLGRLHSLQRGLSSCKKKLIAEGFLTEADFL